MRFFSSFFQIGTSEWRFFVLSIEISYYAMKIFNSLYYFLWNETERGTTKENINSSQRSWENIGVQILASEKKVGGMAERNAC